MPKTVLGVDQSLSNTGMVVVAIGTVPDLLSKHMLTSRSAVEGTESALRRAVELHGEFRNFMKLMSSWEVDEIIHETPPTANRMQRPESSLLAAMGLRLAAEEFGLPYLAVHSNTAKLHFTGSGVAKKPVMHERMWGIYPEIKAKKLNEHQADALALVIAHHYPELSAKNRKP